MIANPLLRPLFAFVFVFAAACLQAQTTWHVAPGGTGTGTAGAPFGAIADGIAAASNGDIVDVAAGTYGEFDLSFLGKDITLKGAGIGSSIIDAANSGRAFLFVNGETSAAVLEGFTIRNCMAQDTLKNGGALLIVAASPSIRACRFTQCQAGNGQDGLGLSHEPGDGGAIWMENGSPSITGCRFDDNQAGIPYDTPHVGGHGGAIAGLNASPQITSCEFSSNQGTLGCPGGSGGAIHGMGGTWTIRGSIFDSNRSGDGHTNFFCIAPRGSGGAISLQGDLVLRDCIFTFNQTGASQGDGAGQGGAVAVVGSLDAGSCRFSDNATLNGGSSWSGNGGAVDCNGPATIRNCLFERNFCEDAGQNDILGVQGGSGGAVATSNGLLTMVGCEIVDNAAGDGWPGQDDGGNGGNGGGISAFGSATLIDCVIKRNAAGNGVPPSHPSGSFGGHGGRGGGVFVAGDLTMIGCIVQENTSGDGATGSYQIGPAGAGGGIATSSPFTMVHIESCVVTQNSTGFEVNGDRAPGGGVSVLATNAVIEASTVSDNVGASELNADSSAVVRGCIVRGAALTPITGPLAVTECNVSGSFPGTGNIDVDPLWIDPTNGNYQLDVGSPCVDLGTFTPAHGIDAAGNPRVRGTAVDLGGLEQGNALLSVNGLTDRVVRMTAGSSITTSMAQPDSTTAPQGFSIAGFLGTPDLNQHTTFPGVGTVALPLPFLNPTPGAFFYASTWGGLGPMFLAGLTPWSISHPTLPFPIVVTFQGIYADPSTASGFDITNRVVVEVTP